MNIHLEMTHYIHEHFWPPASKKKRDLTSNGVHSNRLDETNRLHAKLARSDEYSFRNDPLHST